MKVGLRPRNNLFRSLAMKNFRGAIPLLAEVLADYTCARHGQILVRVWVPSFNPDTYTYFGVPYC